MTEVNQNTELNDNMGSNSEKKMTSEEKTSEEKTSEEKTSEPQSEKIIKKKMILKLKKRPEALAAKPEFQEKMQEVKEEIYPVFNELILGKIFRYMEISELLEWSVICWKFRILIRDRINHIWHFFWLRLNDRLPVRGWQHCHNKIEYYFNSRGRRTHRYVGGSKLELTLGCLSSSVLSKFNYPTTYNWGYNNQNSNLPNYHDYQQIMKTPISKSRVGESKFKIIPEVGTPNQPERTWDLKNINNTCRYRHHWKKLHYPYGDPIYQKSYDPNVNYFWKISDELSSKFLNIRSHGNWGQSLEQTAQKLEKQLEEIKHAKKRNDQMLRLQRMASERAHILGDPGIRPRFHYFRDLHLKKTGEYLSPSQASKLWAKKTDQEKERYATLAKIEHDAHLRRRKLYQKRF